MKNIIKKGLEDVVIFLLVLLIFLSFNQTLLAGYYSSGFKTGKLTYTYESGSSSTIGKTAVNVWNGVSKKVNLSKYSGSNALYRASITISCNKYKPPTSGEYGKMIPYKAYGQNSASQDKKPNSGSTWVKAFCYQYKNSDFGNNTQRSATAAHEIGHALSLSHAPSSTLSALMKQGLKYNCKLYSYDKKSLKSKWGK